ncbi:helix-turn-helix domain-containing protein [Aerococcus mictus]|uniref:helix-turn-helix domain-containing protein n=1 Tax=Aerococcus mictus TaxID=2976810 RepID=UPI00227BD8F5|nr:helix-turn-helix transcriptional regulator [Aerococcus mictus]MCY3076760.1 helix-turn-helix transcriptional regulator [Aerococcus mictus]
MGFSYDKLWKKLIDEKMNKLDLQKAINTSPRTIAKMGRDENVSMEILGRNCRYIKYDISEVLEYRIENTND